MVWATVGTFPYKFWYATVISAIMWLNMNCLCATYVDQNQRAFLAQMTSFVVRYDFIYDFFRISSQYLMIRGVDSPAIGQVITRPARKSTHPILMECTFFSSPEDHDRVQVSTCTWKMMNTNLKQLHESVMKELLNKSYCIHKHSLLFNNDIVLTSSSPDQFSLVVSVFPSAWLPILRQSIVFKK